MRPLALCLLATLGFAGAQHAALLATEIKELSIEEQVELLRRLRGAWSSQLMRRVEVEGEKWPALDDLYGPVSRLTVKEQESLVEQTRAILRRRLLEPIGGFARAYDKLDKSIRVDRLLNRGLFDPKDLPDCGGACFSFVDRNHKRDRTTNVRLEQWRVRAVHGGIAEIDRKSIRTVKLADVPAILRGKKAPRWRIDQQAPKAVVGQLYAVRSIGGKADVLAAFEIIRKDRYGVTFAWKILKRSRR